MCIDTVHGWVQDPGEHLKKKLRGKWTCRKPEVLVHDTDKQPLVPTRPCSSLKCETTYGSWLNWMTRWGCDCWLIKFRAVMPVLDCSWLLCSDLHSELLGCSCYEHHATSKPDKFLRWHSKTWLRTVHGAKDGLASCNKPQSAQEPTVGPTRRSSSRWCLAVHSHFIASGDWIAPYSLGLCLFFLITLAHAFHVLVCLSVMLLSTKIETVNLCPLPGLLVSQQHTITRCQWRWL